MDKKAFISIGAAITICTFTSTSTLLANTVSNTALQTNMVSAMSADDFIQSFAGYYVRTHEDADLPEDIASDFVWYKSADANNAALILKGYGVYQSLSKDVQKEISDAYKDNDLNYEALVAQARNIQTQIDLAMKKEQEAAEAAKKQEQAQANENKQTAPATTSNAAPAAASSTNSAAQNQSAANGNAAAPAQNAQSQTDQSETQQPSVKVDAQNQTVQNGSAKVDSKADGNAEAKTDDASQSTTPAQKQDANTTQQSAPVNPDPSKTTEQENTEDKKDEQAQQTTEKSESEAQDTEQKEQPEAEVVSLYSESMEPNLHIELTGSEGKLDDQRQKALDAWLASQQLSADKVYGTTTLVASDPNFAAYRQDLAAVQTGDQLKVLSVANGQEGKLVVTEYNMAVKNISFDTMTIDLGVKDQFVYDIPVQPEKEEQKADQNQQEQPSENENQNQNPVPADEDQQANEVLAVAVEGSQNQVLKAAAPAVSSYVNQTKPVAIQNNIAPQPAAAKTASAAALSVPQRSTMAYQSAQAPLISPNNSGIGGLTALNNAAVNNFVSTYCSNSTGVVYSMANSLNYKQILNGYSVWRSMTTAEKTAVNNKLQSSGSTRYQDLYIQANKVRLGMSVSSAGGNGSLTSANRTPVVNTATQSNGLFYSLTTSIFGALAVYFGIKSRRETKEENM